MSGICTAYRSWISIKCAEDRDETAYNLHCMILASGRGGPFSYSNRFSLVLIPCRLNISFRACFHPMNLQSRELGLTQSWPSGFTFAYTSYRRQTLYSGLDRARPGIRGVDSRLVRPSFIGCHALGPFPRAVIAENEVLLELESSATLA